LSDNLLINNDYLIDDIIVGVFILLIIIAYFFLKIKRSYTNRIAFIIDKNRFRHIRILRRYFPFFNLLPKTEQRKFLRRIAYFIDLKSYQPVDFNEVTEEMKVLIAACAIQLTYGLPEVYLSHFKTIEILKNQATQKATSAATAIDEAQGKMSLSWQAFIKGYIQPSGSYNYGLHEMARALQLENTIKNEEFYFMKEEDLLLWSQEAQRVLEQVRSQGQNFFDQFAGDLKGEFFSVVVESFFERPIEFQASFPDLYKLTSILLKQNPAVLFQSTVD
jgi:hypothetical protein